MLVVVRSIVRYSPNPKIETDQTAHCPISMHRTTVDSSSGPESSMDFVNHPETPSKRAVFAATEVDVDQGDDGGVGDVEVWDQFNRRFREVQSVLDRNRALIQQVNQNHSSRVADNMVKNVGLIQEINGNISKVVSLYSDLSSNFSTFFHHRNAAEAKGGDANNPQN